MFLIPSTQGWGQTAAFRSPYPSTASSRSDFTDLPTSTPSTRFQYVESTPSPGSRQTIGRFAEPYRRFAWNVDETKSGKQETAPKKKEQKKDDKKTDEASKENGDDDTTCTFPKWNFEIGVVGFTRSQPSRVALVLDDASSAVLLDANDSRFEYKMGLFGRASRSYGVGSLEIGYLGSCEWDSVSGVQGDLNLLGPGFQLAVNPGVFVLETESAFHCGEIAYRVDTWDCWSWSAGFRYVRFDDQLTISELNAPFLGALNIDCDNNLYGFHLGSQWSIFDRGMPLTLQLFAGAGIYGSDIRQQTRSSFVGPAVVASDLGTAFSGELGLNLRYKFSENVEIGGGYRFMGYGGIALAPEQIVGTDISTSEGEVQYGTLFLHGAHLGLQFSW